MLPKEIQKRFEVLSPSDEKERIRKKLAEDTMKFLENDGIIKQIKQGVTSEYQDADIPIPLQKDYKKVHEQLAIARINASKKAGRKPKTDATMTDNRFLGMRCDICGSSVRYLSNQDCVVCAAARYKRNARPDI